MKTRTILATSVSALAFSAGMASAQDFYANFGLEIGSGQLEDAAFTYDLNYTGAAATGGVSFPIGQSGFIGGEAGVVLPLSYDSDWTNSEFDLITRLRVVGGTEIGGVTVFASAGVTQISGDVFTGIVAADGDGTSLGIGVDVPVSTNSILRIELVSDEVEFSDPNYRWESTALRGAAILNF